MLRRFSTKPSDSKYIQMAIEEAKTAATSGDGQTFGAVLIRNGQLIGRAHSETLKKKDPTAHAEIVLLQTVCKFFNSPRLPDGCKLYLSAEPCPMCLTACMWANVECIYYAASAKECLAAGGAIGDQYNLLQTDFIAKINDPEWKEGHVKQILADEAKKLFL